MPSLNELLESENAKKMLRDSTTMDRLTHAPESQRLLELLDRQANGDLETLASAAEQGDTKPLMTALQSLLNDPESTKLLETLSRSLPR